MAAILKISDLHKQFGPLEVLRGISLDVDPGQVVALVGASGSGKTTLLRCVNALEDYHKGSIYLGDEQLGYQELNGRRVRLPESRVTRQRAELGMVFQSYNLFPHMTVLDNVALGLVHVQKKPRAEAKRIALSWIDRVGLADKIKAYSFQPFRGHEQAG